VEDDEGNEEEVSNTTVLQWKLTFLLLTSACAGLWKNGIAGNYVPTMPPLPPSR
jgi:hypothetical protein